MDATVSKRWLLARLYEPEQTIVDCRFTLGKPQAGRESYEQEHIPGAVYLDLELDLSGPVGEHGGRHPSPTRRYLLHASRSWESEMIHALSPMMTKVA